MNRLDIHATKKNWNNTKKKGQRKSTWEKFKPKLRSWFTFVIRKSQWLSTGGGCSELCPENDQCNYEMTGASWSHFLFWGVLKKKLKHFKGKANRHQNAKLFKGNEKLKRHCGSRKRLGCHFGVLYVSVSLSLSLRESSSLGSLVPWDVTYELQYYINVSSSLSAK